MSNSTSGQITGKLYAKRNAVQKSDTFKTRLFVLETGGEYGQLIPFELYNDKCSLIDGMKQGQTLTAHYNIRGNEWQPSDGSESKFFLSFNAWKIDTAAAPAAQPATQQTAAVTPTVIDGNNDDLPF